MKKLAAILSIALLLAASNANAVTRWSYNPTTFSPIRVLSQWYLGYNSQAIIYSHNANGCLVVTVIQYAFGIETGRRVTEIC